MWMDMFVCCFSAKCIWGKTVYFANFCRFFVFHWSRFGNLVFEHLTFWQDKLSRQLFKSTTLKGEETLLHLRSLSICSVWPFLPISSQMPELTDEFSELVRARMAL